MVTSPDPLQPGPHGDGGHHRGPLVAGHLLRWISALPMLALPYLHIYYLLSITCGRYSVRGVARGAALRLCPGELLPGQEASQAGLHQDDPETSHLLKMKRRHSTSHCGLWTL